MIQICHLEFRYGAEFCLRIPELQVDSGTTAAIIGPSGSGKTTLLNLVAGITVPSSGSVVTSGVDVTQLAEAGRRDFRIKNLGLVFQEFELLEYLNVLDNILLPYRINRTLRLDQTVRDRAVELSRNVGIDDKLSRYANKLSQGEKQRVAVCRALLAGPNLLLADEPTGNLDPINKDRVLDILFDYAERSGATLLTVTHDHELLGRFERVIDFKDFQYFSGPNGATGRPSPGGAAS